MRAVIQRVSEASVSINGRIKAGIKQGLVVLIGIEAADNKDDVDWLCNKIVRLRIFDDENGIMNLSVQDIGGEIIVVSQFTLHAKTKKGNRPSYIKAANPEHAVPLYRDVITNLTALNGKETGSGEFGANMEISLTNSGPVTIIIDTKDKE